MGLVRYRRLNAVTTALQPSKKSAHASWVAFHRTVYSTSLLICFSLFFRSDPSAKLFSISNVLTPCWPHYLPQYRSSLRGLSNRTSSSSRWNEQAHGSRRWVESSGCPPPPQSDHFLLWQHPSKQLSLIVTPWMLLQSRKASSKLQTYTKLRDLRNDGSVATIKLLLSSLYIMEENALRDRY